MASRSTAFPDGPRMRAFRAADDVIRADPALVAGVRTFASWRGDGVEKMPIASGMLPYLGLTPVLMPNEVMGESRSVAVVGVAIEIAVAGLVAEDFVNFWDAVEDAFVKGKEFRGTTVYCYLQSRGAFAHRMTAPPMRPTGPEDDAAAEFLAGSGMLVLRISRIA